MARHITKFARLVPPDGSVSSDGKLVLYGADTPNTWKPAALLEEMEIPYDVVFVNIMKNEQKQPDYLAMNPNGRTPTLLDRTVCPPFSVFESGAIMLYVAEKHGTPLLPEKPEPKSEVVQWLMWQMSALGPMVGNCMYMKRIAAPVQDDVSKVQFGIDRFHNETVRLLTILETRLNNRDYLCGPDRGVFTIADIACFGYAAQHFWASVDISDMPFLSAWIARVGARPSIKSAATVPGISISEGFPTFEQIRTDETIQSQLLESAAKAGRPYFGWKDMQELWGKPAEDAAVPFASHVPGSEAK
uniref:Glutathione transferase n=1 Tax=Zooxanthella nutricula TaxID=1333877 RepID=A0A7S2QC38_9DINO